ncbi:MAG: hypothetical protein WC812_00345 [Candidatus Pacearchaeota archaeon]|jgi:hypothetical protein
MTKELIVYNSPSINELEKLVQENPKKWNKKNGVIESVFSFEDSEDFDCDGKYDDLTIKVEARYFNEKRGARFIISQSKIEKLIKEKIIKSQKDLIGKKIIAYSINKEIISYDNLQNVKIFFD